MRKVLLIGVCVLALAATARADLSNLMAARDVPGAVKKAADRAAPGVNWLVARKKVEDGKDYYFLLGRETGNGKRLVEYAGRADGKVGYVRVTVPNGEVPAAVTGALQKKAPGFQIERAQITGMTVAAIVAYRLEGKTKSGGKAAFLVSTSGQKIIRE
jgi:hypothetical protein